MSRWTWKPQGWRGKPWGVQGSPRAGSTGGGLCQETRQQKGGHADPCRFSTRPSSNQAQPTNPSARFSVLPPDVPAPHPTPCTPPRLLLRHTLHLLCSLGTLSQTRPCGVNSLSVPAPGLSSTAAAKRYHGFPSPSQAVTQSGLLRTTEPTSTQPAQLLMSKRDPTRHPT